MTGLSCRWRSCFTPESLDTATTSFGSFWELFRAKPSLRVPVKLRVACLSNAATKSFTSPSNSLR